MILAPLRGVTIKCFRRIFADQIKAAGFKEAFTPFISAMPGVDPLRDRELTDAEDAGIEITPQFIGKDPEALRNCLGKIKKAGYVAADLNCGCPFPMIRNKGRGSGLLQRRELLQRMLDAGCEVMGAGNFSIKTRLGVERNDELIGLMDVINSYPLRFITVHARNARQMYSGECDREEFRRIVEASKIPVVENGDLDWKSGKGMVGRSFIRELGLRDDCAGLLRRYIDASQEELHGDRPVLGRIKELVGYWSELPQWRRKWQIIKMCRTTDELRSII